MSSWLERAEDQLKTHAATLRGLEAIASIVKHTAPSNWQTAIEVIEKITDTLIAGFDGKITQDEIEEHLRDLVNRVRASDETADRALDDKFDPST